MGKDTKIEWCDHSWNPWRGCTKVSEGCKNCYAKTLSKRNPKVLGMWGPQGTRVIASETMWKEPLKWNEEAKTSGVRRRVFCASLADVFEDSTTMPAEDWLSVERARARLFQIIKDTPCLDWLLVTKRPHRVNEYVPPSWHEHGFPSNVWIGTSVENQAAADKRVPELLKIPAAVRFLSCEPLLGPVDLDKAVEIAPGIGCFPLLLQPTETETRLCGAQGRIDWVIAGGESGPGARPMFAEWALSLRDQCIAAGVPFFFKQHGEYISLDQMKRGSLKDFELRVGHQVTRRADGTDEYWKLGKGVTGRELDGREWSQFPSCEVKL